MIEESDSFLALATRLTGIEPLLWFSILFDPNPLHADLIPWGSILIQSRNTLNSNASCLEGD